MVTVIMLTEMAFAHLTHVISGPLGPCQINNYMELVNEHPDSYKTMCLVAEDLLEKFDTKEQQGWVELVVDSKTYQHLMNIKQQYGTALEKSIVFPGDWHTLKNLNESILSCGLARISQMLWIL